MKSLLDRAVRKAKWEASAIIGKIIGKHITFVTIKELKEWTEAWQLPHLHEVVLGIPRSGIPIACHIAQKTGTLFSTPNLLVNKRAYKPSDTLYNELVDSVRYGATGDQIENILRKQRHITPITENILLVDDSLNTGETMKQNKAKLESTFPNSTIRTAALIVTKEYRSLVDYNYKLLNRDRLFEWALAYVNLGKLVADMDGVLCENCPSLENYKEWLKTAKPKIVPKRRIDTIVTARKEAFRVETQEWLKTHNVNYENLLMEQDVPTKIEAIKKLKPNMVWESDKGHARLIWKATRIPTLCFDTMEMFSR